MKKLVIMLCIFLLISFSTVPVFADSVDTSLTKYFTIGFNLNGVASQNIPNEIPDFRQQRKIFSVIRSAIKQYKGMERGNKDGT